MPILLEKDTRLIEDLLKDTHDYCVKQVVFPHEKNRHGLVYVDFGDKHRVLRLQPGWYSEVYFTSREHYLKGAVFARFVDHEDALVNIVQSVAGWYPDMIGLEATVKGGLAIATMMGKYPYDKVRNIGINHCIIEACGTFVFKIDMRFETTI